uniref:Protein tyrosine phosphatase n=1 Tax=Trepomonas sp. PC1 TaxID=1076344 RepID=A0A146K5Z8_9EUKA|eukprot:JAP92292.1 Protein tyrosine phosphatase [Trepomonas sp. PC1]
MYENYYRNEMQKIMDRRVRELNDSLKQQHCNFCQDNRYQSVMSYLRTQPSKAYFNGNIVQLGQFVFLITQAPTNIPAFYKEIFDFRANSIIQLTKFVEEMAPKAERYVPLSEGESAEFYSESVEAQYISDALKALKQKSTTKQIFLTKEQIQTQKQQPKDSFVWHRKTLDFAQEKLQIQAGNFKKIGDDFYQIPLQIQFSVQQEFFKNFNQKLECDYFYYGKWFDFQKSTEAQIFELCQTCLGVKSDKIVIHCSAGIGRSATYAICLYIFKCFQNGDLKDEKEAWKRLPISIYESVEILRTQRNPMCVQTVEQFLFLFEFADYCSKQFTK